MFYPTIMQVLTHFVQVLTLISANILQLPRLFRQIIYRSTKKLPTFTSQQFTNLILWITTLPLYPCGRGFIVYTFVNIVLICPFRLASLSLHALQLVYRLVLYNLPFSAMVNAGLSVSNVLPQHAQILMYFFISLT